MKKLKATKSFLTPNSPRAQLAFVQLPSSKQFIRMISFTKASVLKHIFKVILSHFYVKLAALGNLITYAGKGSP